MDFNVIPNENAKAGVINKPYTASDPIGLQQRLIVHRLLTLTLCSPAKALDGGPKCPPRHQNGVRHDPRMPSAIKSESCPS